MLGKKQTKKKLAPYPDEDLLCREKSLHETEGTLHVVPQQGNAQRTTYASDEPSEQMDLHIALHLRKAVTALVADTPFIHAMRMPAGHLPEGLEAYDELWWLHYPMTVEGEVKRRHFENILSSHGMRRASENERETSRKVLQCEDGFIAPLQPVGPPHGTLSGRARRRALTMACAALCAKESLPGLVVRTTNPSNNKKEEDRNIEFTLWTGIVGDDAKARKQALSMFSERLQGTKCTIGPTTTTMFGRMMSRMTKDQSEKVPEAGETAVMLAPWQAIYQTSE